MAQGERFIPRINGYAIDAVVSESHARESEVTKVPVESGSEVTDNNKPKNRTVTIEGIVTNTPSGDMVAERADFFTPTGELGQTLPAQAFVDMIDDAQANSETITVETEFRSYAALSITKFEVPRDKDVGFAVKFTLACEELRIRKTNRLTVRLLVANSGVSSKKKVGAKNTTAKTNPALVIHPGDKQADGSYETYRSMGGTKTPDEFRQEHTKNRIKTQGVGAIFDDEARQLVKDKHRLATDAKNEYLDNATDNKYIKAVGPIPSYLARKGFGAMDYLFGDD